MAFLEISIIAAFGLIANPVIAAPHFGETCSGTEIVQIGSQSPKKLAYHLDFSADLTKRLYCYGPCGEEETYAISDPVSVPIVLTNVNVPSSFRHLTFDPTTLKISDTQSFDGGLAVVKRQATATCVPAAFHEPQQQSR